MSETRGFTPIRIFIGLLALSVAVSYASGSAHGWWAPADVRQITDELWTLLPVTPDEVSSTMLKAADRGLLSFAGWAGIALLAADGLTSWADLHRLASWLSWLGATLAALGVVQYFTAVDIAGFLQIPGLVANADFGLVDSRSILNRVSGTASHPIEYGVVLAAIFPLALHYGFTHRSRATAWVPAIIIGIGAPMSVSRSAVLALAVGFIVLLAGWSPARRRKAIIVAPLAALALRLAIPGLLGTIVSLFTNLFNDPSISGRTADYGVVFSVYADHPWFGRGLFTFVPRFYRILDNQYLMSLIELGAIGLTVVLVLFIGGYLAARIARRRATEAEDKDITLALSASLAGLAASYATFDAWGFPMAAGITFLTLGMIGAAGQNARRDAQARTQSPSAKSDPPTNSEPKDQCQGMNDVHESVAVVVVTFNSAGLIADLVPSLQPGLAGIPWQLIFADNASTDDTVATLARLAPTATVVEMGRNAGYAAGINAAVAASLPHTAVLVLNPDVRLGAGCVPELLRALREPGVGIAVPRLFDANAVLIDSMRRAPTCLRALGDALIGARRAGRYPALGEMVRDSRLYEYESDTDWAEGSTQLISDDCWHAIGPWDESYFLYSEEAEFDLRAADSGFATRYVPSAHATHLEGDSGSSPGLWALLVINRVKLFRRRNGLPRAVPFWAITLLREASRTLLGKPTSRAAVRALLSPARLRETPGPHSVR